MLTPLEIQNKTFPKGLRGYDVHEVDDFMLEIFTTIDTLLNDQAKLIARTDQLEKDLERFEKIEQTLKDALVVAQSTADDVVKQANEKAAVIVEKAEVTAKRRLDEADQEVQKIRRERAELEQRYSQFVTRFKVLLTGELEGIEKIVLDE